MVTPHPKAPESLAAYQQYVRSQLKRYGAPEGALDDLTQEVWLVALVREPEFPDEARARAWFSQVCRRVASSHRRSTARLTVVDPEELTTAAVEPSQLPQIERERSAVVGLSAVAQLSERKRDVLSLYGSGLLTMKEVAELAGLPEPTAYARYRAALEEVQRLRRRARHSTLRPPAEVVRAPTQSGVTPSAEAAADAGDLTIYRADGMFGVGRLGNVVVNRWSNGDLEQTLADLGSVIDLTHQRMGVPIVLISDIAPELKLPNAQERELLRTHLRSHAGHVAISVDIMNTRFTRWLAAILTGALWITRSPSSVAFVKSVEEAQSWVEPWSRSCTGQLPWPSVERALHRLRQQCAEP